MKYCYITDPDTKAHLLRLIDWLCNEVRSSGGDGDALWYSKFYNINDILILLIEYNDKQKFKWTIEFDGETINAHDNQECLLITNSEQVYNSRPDWQQCVIVN